MRTGHSGIEALGGPGDPVGAVAQDHKGQEFAAIIDAMPSDGAVTVCSHHDSAAAGDIDRPNIAWRFIVPKELAFGVIAGKIEAAAENKAAFIRRDRKASRGVTFRKKDDPLVAKYWGLAVAP